MMVKEIFLIVLLGWLSSAVESNEDDIFEPIVLVHGGAGTIPPNGASAKARGVKLAARIGYKTLLETGSAVDAVEAAVRSMELDDDFNAGYGSVLTFDGTVECDASIMDGRTLEAGCVSIVQNILHPISLARRIMEKNRHTYMVADGVMKFAVEQGFDILPPGYLVTPQAQKALEDYKNSLNNSNSSGGQYGSPGTVGAVAVDSKGNFAAATSTGGLTGKLPGRVGDSPLLGSGTYADNLQGCLSATGAGEPIMRFNVAQRILQASTLKSMSGQDAAQEILNEMEDRLNGTAGVILIDGHGDVGIYFTTNSMSWAYQKGKNVFYGIYKGENLTDIVDDADDMN